MRGFEFLDSVFETVATTTGSSSQPSPEVDDSDSTPESSWEEKREGQNAQSPEDEAEVETRQTPEQEFTTTTVDDDAATSPDSPDSESISAAASAATEAAAHRSHHSTPLTAGSRELRYPFFDPVKPYSPFRSLGSTKPWWGELEEPGALKEMLEARSFKGELIMLTTDAERLELSANFINMLVHRWGFDHYILIGLNEASCVNLRDSDAVYSHQISCAWSNFLGKDLVAAGSSLKRIWNGINHMNNIAQLWMTRHRLMEKFIDHGVNVLSIDNDAAIVTDPYIDFKSSNARDDGVSPGDVELFVQHHGGFPGICAGVIYQQNAKPGGGVQFFFHEVWSRMLDAAKGPPLFSQIPGQVGAPFIESYTFDQGPTDDVIESSVGATSENCNAANRYAHEGVMLLVKDEIQSVPPRWEDVEENRRMPAWTRDHIVAGGGGPCSTSFRHQLWKLQNDHAGFIDSFANDEWTWVKGTGKDHLLSVPKVGRGEPLKCFRDLMLPMSQPHVLEGGRHERIGIAPGYMVSAWSDAFESATWHVKGGGSALAHAVGQSGGNINKVFLMRALGWYHPRSDKAAGMERMMKGLLERRNELETFAKPPPEFHPGDTVWDAFEKAVRENRVDLTEGSGPRMLAFKSTPGLLKMLSTSKEVFRAAFGRLFLIALSLGRKPVVPLIPCSAPWFSQRPENYATNTILRDVQALSTPVADPLGPAPPEAGRWEGVGYGADGTGSSFGHNADTALCYWNPLLNYWQICDEQFLYHHHDIATYTARVPIEGWTLPGDRNVVSVLEPCKGLAGTNGTYDAGYLLTHPPTMKLAALHALKDVPIVYLDVGEETDPSCVPAVEAEEVKKYMADSNWQKHVVHMSDAFRACSVCTDSDECRKIWVRPDWTYKPGEPQDNY